METTHKRARGGSGAEVGGDEKMLTETLRLCGFLDTRRAEAAEWEAEFVRLTGGPDKTMSRALFVADCVQRGDDPIWARATFRGTDVDGSGAINLHEYILGRAAVVYDPVRDSGTPLVEARLRVAFHFYDSNDDGLLSAAELLSMVRDLAAGDSHVDKLVQRLHPCAAPSRPSSHPMRSPTPANVEKGALAKGSAEGGLAEGTAEESGEEAENASPGGKRKAENASPEGTAATESITLAGFMSTALGALHGAELSSRDLLRQPKSRGPTQRAVLEPRAVAAGVASPVAVAAAGSAEAMAAGLAPLPDLRALRQVTYFGGGALDPAVRPPLEVNDGPAFVLGPYAASDGCSWRGALLNESDGGRVVALAGEVVASARRLTRELERLNDSQAGGKGARAANVTDGSWLTGGKALDALFGTTDRATQLASFIAIAGDCRRIVAAQPSVVRVRAPAKVFGDVHGQLRDLLALFAAYGFPSHVDGGDVEAVSYVFNGDLVDRGAHQLEVCALAMALKVCYPTRVWINRGNHEFREINEETSNGFKAQCDVYFPPARVLALRRGADSNDRAEVAAATSAAGVCEGPLVRGMRRESSAPPLHPPLPPAAADEGHDVFGDVADAALPPRATAESPFYTAAHAVFGWLPLAALVGPPGASARPVLVLHGGIGDGTWTVDDLRRLTPRPLEEEWDAPPCVAHALWSDPSDSDTCAAIGVHGSPRGQGAITFGPDVTAAFCAASRVSMVVRSHQWVPHGYKVMHGGRLITVFSARNYQGQVENDSAILLIADDDDGNLRVRPKRLLKLGGAL